MKKIGLASDHAGYALKEHVKKYLSARNIEYIDFGTHSEASCDYPDYGHALGQAIDNGDVSIGIAICGSGQGISMTLNKHQHVRAALCWQADIARLARQHNDANVLVMPGRFLYECEADAIMDEFLSTPFEGGRHIRRIEKIPCQG
ncbi:MAG: ribose 5-phosphate isomerase B [Bacteroidaceae bacterium]